MNEENNLRDSFDQDFCSFLEYEIGKALEKSEDKIISSVWCDGISHVSLDKSKKLVNQFRKLTTLAWLGKNGQDEYQMTVRFGDKALSRYMRDLDLKMCAPSVESSDWIEIDVEKKTIVVQLL
ncbi:MAG: hypothetical protein K0S32_3869 [Bacteroidetes bacterium]|nr:hypothetical protein [Bacteroidota bacterium]